MPLNEEPFFKFIVNLEIESTTIFPSADCLDKFKVTVPPLLPELPHESAWILKKLPAESLLTIVLPSKLIVAVVESAKTGKIYTGFCIEGASGVINLCAERIAALNMYINEGNMIVKRMIAFRNEAPKRNGGMPCGACREFFMQCAYENRDMEILVDFETRKTVLLKDLIPNWWGDKRYKDHK